MKYFLSVSICFLFFMPAQSNPSNLESVIRFGDSLFLQGDLNNALNEYQRAYFFSGGELKSKLSEKIADCYLVLNNYKMARSFYDSVAVYSENESRRLNCEFQKILCLMKENNFGYALLKLENLEVRDKVQLLRKKNLYQGICYFGIGQYEASHQNLLNSISEADTARRLQLEHLFTNQFLLKRPNSRLAIMLSLVIPGTGQFYSGDIKNGINSILLLSGIFYLGTMASSSGLVLVVPIFCRYYVGGIVHAKQIADQKREKNKYIYYTNLMEILLK